MFAGYISILSWQEANYLIHVHGNMQAKRNFFITFLSLVLVYFNTKRIFNHPQNKTLVDLLLSMKIHWENQSKTTIR